MRRTRVVLFAVVLPALAIEAACTLTPNVPNAQILCDLGAPRCPSGFTCEAVSQAPVSIGLCCRSAGCASNLTPGQIAEIVDAGVSSGLVDAGPRDAPSDHATDAGDDGRAGDGGGSDAGPVCGNGRLEGAETCDPPSACPTSCPRVGCDIQTLQGSAADCTAKCVSSGQKLTQCVGGDNCCPTGCTVDNDPDCNCACGNGVVEIACGETCDPLTTCPTSCPPMGCQLRALQGTGCAAACVNTTTITACTNGDGCCPPGCNANDDNNCTPVCGNGVIEPNETCDPPSTACQAQFDMCVGDANTIRVRSGVVANCTFQCTSMVRTCSGTSDGFCPSSCTPCVGACAAGQDIDCRLPNGGSCTNDSQCTGSCIDGHCCASTCGTCFQCTGANGACVPIPQYTEDNVPANACTGASSCDGAGNCKLDNGQTCTGTGATCASGFCADGVCCSSACAGACDTCTGAGGTCVISGAGTAGAPSCSPYVCNGTGASCPSSCTMNAQCAAGFFCVGNACQKKPIGTACGGNSECANNQCVSGYCCDGTCSGVCQSCGRSAAPGICGAAPLGELPNPPGCGAYLCDGSVTTTCPTGCSSNSVCQNGYTCQQGTCQLCAMTGAACSQAQAARCCSGVCFNFQCQ